MADDDTSDFVRAISKMTEQDQLRLLIVFHREHRRLCKDEECLICGRIWCPSHEPLHFHHDGCPACVLPRKNDDYHEPRCECRECSGK